MYSVIPDVLDVAELAEAVKLLGAVTFVDGRSTAGAHARLVKQNLQAGPADESVRGLKEYVAAKINANALFRIVTRPKLLTPLILSRYEPGMVYGTHVDDALMNGVRSDVSFTLFLSDPMSYDGGALVIETAYGEQVIRPPAGSLVAYPSTTLHRVAEVTRGVRLAAVGWVRSFVRDPARREVLYDLETACDRIFRKDGKTAEVDLLSKSSENLLRMWSDD
jgi:PKHD-type hydroxylase